MKNMSEERLAEAAGLMVEMTAKALPGWVVAHVARLVEAWGQLEPEEASTALEVAEVAGTAAGQRVAGDLAALLAVDAAGQRATPLEVVRTAVAEPTAVLRAAGIPEVVREGWVERAWPDDVYDLTPRTFRDIDNDLAAVHFAWGVAKAEVLRARAEEAQR